MNERIKQLAQQALNEVTRNGPRELEVALGPFEIKFAELIVRECSLMCIEDKDSQRIEKHFGVEE